MLSSLSPERFFSFPAHWIKISQCLYTHNVSMSLLLLIPLRFFREEFKFVHPTVTTFSDQAYCLSKFHAVFKDYLSFNVLPTEVGSPVLFSCRLHKKMWATAACTPSCKASKPVKVSFVTCSQIIPFSDSFWFCVFPCKHFSSKESSLSLWKTGLTTALTLSGRPGPGL